MTTKEGILRKFGLVSICGLLMTALAFPAFATPPDDSSGLESGHKITICHATRSLSHPFVEITIDISAWDIADPDSNDHGPQHHLRVKDGIAWADYALNGPDDECTLDGAGTTTTTSEPGNEV